jgi:hypothetical protein
MKIKGLLDPRLRGDDNKASFRMRTSLTTIAHLHNSSYMD